MFEYRSEETTTKSRLNSDTLICIDVEEDENCYIFRFIGFNVSKLDFNKEDVVHLKVKKTNNLKVTLNKGESYSLSIKTSISKDNNLGEYKCKNLEIKGIASIYEVTRFLVKSGFEVMLYE